MALGGGGKMQQGNILMPATPHLDHLLGGQGAGVQRISQRIHQVCAASHVLDSGSRAGRSWVGRRRQVCHNCCPLRRRLAAMPAQGRASRSQLIGSGS